jgi:hypothetical protein
MLIVSKFPRLMSCQLNLLMPGVARGYRDRTTLTVSEPDSVTTLTK